ncbi:uncharacterized protein LOC123921484 isoform X4 [Trifolium pratense]|uniref:uncharacterized protein LOC123921484 isoform X4 n=1 Tax=Trifolium pratense TaxID=57577 RepID=UPI001E693AD1|nr:uncharacterized protein LOC123921484 isoform X4 [Trifolium pratense]XP_045830045.1 uncharacterized protein LOC123921484 isoform X4 [Trifolium pratense]
MSTTLEYSQLVFNHDGIRNLKVNEVKAENFMSVPTNNPYDGGVSKTVSNTHAFKEGDHSIPTSLTYSKGDANVILMDGAFDRTDNNLMSMSQSYNKGDDNFSIASTYNDICNSISMDQGYNHVDSNVMSIAQPNNKAHGGSTIISFGDCDNDDVTPSDLFVSDYGLFMGQAPLCMSHMSQVANEKEFVRSSTKKLLPSTAQTSASETENVTKTKEEMEMCKKATSNNFPSNVRSLLSTGMLDGVSVKYKAWSREKELRAVIKGAGYLCSCPSCSFSKVINAFEFERHVGCKTKHPNNHIYFENGKTIYGVIQELRSTPQNMLFEVIQISNNNWFTYQSESLPHLESTRAPAHMWKR